MINSKPSRHRAKLAEKLFKSVVRDTRNLVYLDNYEDQLNQLYNAYKRLLMAKGVYRGKSTMLIKERLKFRQKIFDRILGRSEFGDAERYLAENLHNEAMHYRQKLEKILYNSEYQTKEKGVTPTNQPQNGPTERS